MKKIISTNEAPAAIGPYSQGVELKDFVFTSGQLPINPSDGSVPEGIVEQTKLCFENAKAILKEANLAMDDVVKVGVFLTDLKYFAEMNEVYATYFPNDKPARSTLGGIQLAKGALVEIEFIAKK